MEPGFTVLARICVHKCIRTYVCYGLSRANEMITSGNDSPARTPNLEFSDVTYSGDYTERIAAARTTTTWKMVRVTAS